MLEGWHGPSSLCSFLGSSSVRCQGMTTTLHGSLMGSNTGKTLGGPKFKGLGCQRSSSPYHRWGCARCCQVAITVPGDNSVDIFTNDVGIVVISNEAGEVQGYNLLVGGGMGRTARFGPVAYASADLPGSVWAHCIRASAY